MDVRSQFASKGLKELPQPHLESASLFFTTEKDALIISWRCSHNGLIRDAVGANSIGRDTKSNISTVFGLCGHPVVFKKKKYQRFGLTAQPARLVER